MVQLNLNLVNQNQMINHLLLINYKLMSLFVIVQMNDDVDVDDGDDDDVR